MPQVHFFKNTKEFPRPGAWVVIAGQLGVIFDIKDHTSDGSTTAVRSVFMHPVDNEGNSINEVAPDGRLVTKTIIAPADSVSPATHDQITSVTRTAYLSPFDSAVLGYPVTDDQLHSMTALQRKTLHRSLNDEDAAQGLIEESEMQLELMKRARIARHPEAVALEAQIEKERQAFVASVEQRRQAMFDTLSNTIK